MYNITYQEELISEIVGEVKPLIEKHWEELAVYKEEIELSPDWEGYKELEDLEMVRAYTARQEGELVGYFVVCINSHLHHQSHLFAVNDVLFIKKELRGTGTGHALLSYGEEALSLLGVSVLILSTNVHSPFDSLCESMGYSLVERTYSKYLGVNE